LGKVLAMVLVLAAIAVGHQHFDFLTYQLLAFIAE
jgi:hypothetical protein